jgi:hypothetical protein
MEYVFPTNEKSEVDTDIIPFEMPNVSVGTGLPDETSSLSVAQVPALHELKYDARLTPRSSVIVVSVA